MRHRLAVGMDVDNHDVILDGDGRGSSINRRHLQLQRLKVFFLSEVVRGGSFPWSMDFVREYDCALALGVFDVFDADRDTCADNLFTDKWMDDLLSKNNSFGDCTSEPKKVSSAASSGVMELKSRAVGTLHGSAVKIPSTSFHI
jgi:hypothetical protein